MPRLLSQPQVQTLLRESTGKVRERKTRKNRKEKMKKRRRKKTMMRKTSPVPQTVGAARSGGAGSAKHDTLSEMITSTT